MKGEQSNKDVDAVEPSGTDSDDKDRDEGRGLRRSRGKSIAYVKREQNHSVTQSQAPTDTAQPASTITTVPAAPGQKDLQTELRELEFEQRQLDLDRKKFELQKRLAKAEASA
jgi:hypothetical protein